ncbi:MAG: isopenicillin N synthase family oxygenase [Pseudonocardiales bacterium]|nr:isopenicillin N synthase family oxygenase [Pseudonocardiales bacterium]
MITPDTDLPIPLLDFSHWRRGSAAQRAVLADQLDDALCRSGFLLLTGHGLSDLGELVRAEAHRFFTLPSKIKARYATTLGGHGWLPLGAEANAFYGHSPSCPDLKESLAFGRELPTDTPHTNQPRPTANVWPSETPQLQSLCTRYITALYQIHAELLAWFATALGLDPTWFHERTDRAPHAFNINHYPPLRDTGLPAPGQFRIGAHTDWGTLTILDRQEGLGGLQIQTPEGNWIDVPAAPGALTINIGDLMARWTGDRWRSTPHRVLPPPTDAPHEYLISLILFCKPNSDTVIAPLPGSIGHTYYPPITAGDYLRERITQTTTHGGRDAPG